MVLHVAVAGHALAVVERDGTSDLATNHILTGSWLWASSPLSRTPAHLAVDSQASRP